MASNYFQIAAPRVGQNALIDFSPVSNALEDYGRARERGMERARLAEERQYQRGRDQRQDARADVEWFGKQAAAIDRLEGPTRDAAWKGLVARHPNAASLTPDYLDPSKGPAMVAAEAGLYRNPLEEQKERLALDLTRAQIAKTRQEAAGGSSDLSLQPVYGRDQAGNLVVMQIGKDGRAVQTAMPPGVQLDLGAKAEAAARGKLESTADQRTSARTSLADNLKDLAQDYLELDKSGAIVNPDRSAVENLQAWARSSDFGQQIGRTVGTADQSTRNRITNLQPLLIANIREATGLSAKAMDSNRELQFYLNMATNPQQDIYSNLKAIEVLDSQYGLGGVLNGLLEEGAINKNTYDKVVRDAKQMAKQRPIPGASASPAGGDPLAEARAAIAKGVPREAVIQRLIENNINPEGL